MKINENKILPISLIVTSYNEAKNVEAWCNTLLAMSNYPNELIVADSDSTDDTVSLLKHFLASSPFRVVVLSGKCSISEGRNKSIKNASNERIAISDFGVEFDSEWIGNIFSSLDQCDWVGGCYKLIWANKTQRSFCRIFDREPQTLNAETFLPSSRSFGIRKKIFLELGGYNTSLIIGEDTEFVLKLKKINAKYCLARNAIVYWYPRETLEQLYTQHFKYAYWDAVAGQNFMRLNHIVFWLVITVPVLLAIFFVNTVGLLMVLFALATIYIKVYKNISKSPFKGGATLYDCLVYYIVLTGGVVGYSIGTMRKKSFFK